MMESIYDRTVQLGEYVPEPTMTELYADVRK